MRFAVGLLAAAAAAFPGCARSRFIEADLAKQSIDEAEEAGADLDEYPALRTANNSIEFAKRAEEAALDDLEDARRDQQQARVRYQEAKRRHEQKSSEFEQVEGALAAAEERLERATAREDELRKQGLSKDELFDAAGATVALERIRVEGLASSRATLRKQIALSELELKDAEAYMHAAEARIDSAEQRLRVARALYDNAQQQAKIAEAEALRAKRSEMGARLLLESRVNR